MRVYLDSIKRNMYLREGMANQIHNMFFVLVVATTMFSAVIMISAHNMEKETTSGMVIDKDHSGRRVVRTVDSRVIEPDNWWLTLYVGNNKITNIRVSKECWEQTRVKDWYDPTEPCPTQTSVRR